MSAKQISKQEDQKGTPPPPTEGLELLSTRKRLKTRNITEEEVQHLRYLRRIKEALSKFDLSKNEIRVYIYLARFGVHKAQRIAEALSIHRTEAYKILRRLEKQGLVTCVFERPMKFLSVPFEKALRGLIEERRQKVHQMEQWKKELLRMWRSLPEPEEKKIRKETFQVLEGRRQVGVKATDLLKECNTEIHMILKDEVLLWLFNSPFFEDLEEIVEEKGVKVMLLTNYSPTSTYVMDEINLGEGDFNYKDIEDVPSFIITDCDQMVLLMSHGEEVEGKPYAIWTNYMTMLKSQRMLFNLLWDN